MTNQPQPKMYEPLATWRDLNGFGYFELLDDGRLALTVDGLEGIIDIHTHLALTFYLARPPNLRVKFKNTCHHFTPKCQVNLNIYSGMNLHDERPKFWIWDFIPCIFSPIRFGKIQTFTLPNLLWEMDALKIEKSVVLAIDRHNFSSNSHRYAPVLAEEPRAVFYCSVHPLDKRAEEKMEGYIQAGARGLKVHPELQGVAMDAPEMINFLKLWKRVSGGLPVLFHSGFNGYEPQKQRELAEIVLYYPGMEALEGVPSVLGHTAMNEYPEACAIAKKFPHVSLDIGGQPPHHVRDILDIMGSADRLMYGSDWPFYPQALPIAKILLATEDCPEVRPDIFRNNAIRLLGL